MNTLRLCRTILFAAALLLMVPIFANDAAKEETMQPPHASKLLRTTHGNGKWFMADRSTLSSAIKDYLAKAKCKPVPGRIVSALSPHAGYSFSGPVAAYTFKAAQENMAGTNTPETVVIIGFTHGETFAGVAFLDGQAISSPLGETPLDAEATEIIMAGRKRLFWNERPHRREHSAENQLPFAQTVFPSAKVILALIGDHDMATVNELVEGLNALAKKQKILVVASTDLLHNPDYDRVTRIDKETLATIAAMNIDGLLKGWTGSNQTCCGIMAVVTAMLFAQSQGVKQGTLLHYRNSGDEFPEGRGQWVVGYGALVFAAP